MLVQNHFIAKLTIHVLLFFCIIFSNLSLAAEKQPDVSVKKFVAMVGMMPNFFEENIYLLVNNNTKQAAIIDPGNKSAEMHEYIQKNQITISMIINTHGHHDHVGANEYYAKKYGVNVYISILDEDFYADYFSDSSVIKDISRVEQIKFGDNIIKVIKNPGHTPGSVSFLIDDILFSGDTLFKGSIGRTWGVLDQKEKNKQIEIANIKQKLMILPDATVVYPGHGESTTIGYERKNNPFLN